MTPEGELATHPAYSHRSRRLPPVEEGFRSLRSRSVHHRSVMRGRIPAPRDARALGRTRPDQLRVSAQAGRRCQRFDADEVRELVEHHHPAGIALARHRHGSRPLQFDPPVGDLKRVVIGTRHRARVKPATCGQVVRPPFQQRDGVSSPGQITAAGKSSPKPRVPTQLDRKRGAIGADRQLGAQRVGRQAPRQRGLTRPRPAGAQAGRQAYSSGTRLRPPSNSRSPTHQATSRPPTSGST